MRRQSERQEVLDSTSPQKIRCLVGTNGWPRKNGGMPPKIQRLNGFGVKEELTHGRIGQEFQMGAEDVMLGLNALEAV